MENQEIIYGRHPVLEYLKTLQKKSSAKLYIARTIHGKIITTILSLAQKNNIPVEQREKEFLSQLTKEANHQGVVLQCAPRTHATSHQEILKTVIAKKGVLVLLDQLTDPHNIGSIIRTAEALGADGIIMSKTHVPDINQTIIKTSAGATAHIPLLTVPNISRFLETAKREGFWVVGTSDHGTHPLQRLAEIKPAIVIIGNEGQGMRRLTEVKCDFIVQIPLKGSISSLNASVAAGIILYEILR
jgi:23S rRNA (guanosine2251-2'-O)-methyltransferase